MVIISQHEGIMSSDAQTLKALGKRIREKRKKAGITQEHLAELCEFDPTYISLLETGKRNPAFLSVAKIAKKLGCSVSDLTDY